MGPGSDGAEAEDRRWMRQALRLARRALGSTAPNPAVGCVILRDGRVVGAGHTQPGGRPHAEAVALAAAGAGAAGATAYVTHEPCCHHGRGAPCAQALVAAGVRRVVIACGTDPDPRVAGGGVALLRAAGIEVTTGLLEAEAVELNAGFASRLARGRPLLTLKLAMSLDGRIATRTGASRWLTGPAARRAVHRLRAAHDGVMVGVGTVLADDPQLTCRLPGRHAPRRHRIVLDTGLRTPPGARLFEEAATQPVWLVVAEDLPAALTAPFAARPGVRVLGCPRGPDGRLDLAAAARRLGAEGLNSLLVEAGGQVAASLVRAGLADRLELHRAPLLLGGDGVPVLASLGVETPDAAPRLRCLRRRVLGADVIESYAFLAPPGAG